MPAKLGLQQNVPLQLESGVPASPRKKMVIFDKKLGIWKQYSDKFLGFSSYWYNTNDMFHDNTTRADNTVSVGVANSGQGYIPKIGTWGINGNAIKSITGTTGDTLLIRYDTTNYMIQADMTGSFGVSTYSIFRLFTHYIDANNNIFIQLYSNGLGLFKTVAANFILLGSYSVPSVDGTYYSIGARVTGNSITVSVNTGQYIAYSMTAAEQTQFIDSNNVGFFFVSAGSPTVNAKVKNIYIAKHLS
jgi:hypothetical protein